MRSNLRSIAAVVVGFIIASIVMMIIETINGRVLHPELAKAAEGMTDRDAIRKLLATAPVSAFVVVLVGWSLGGISGGWVTARMAARSKLAHGFVLGGVLTLAGVANNLILPPPVWFWIVSFPIMLPSAYVGACLVRKSQAAPNPAA